MSAKLKKLIESSEQKITAPNDCYNSGIIKIQYKKNSGGYEFENVKASLFYGKYLELILWKNEKPFFEQTLSSLKLNFEDGEFKNRFITLKTIKL